MGSTLHCVKYNQNGLNEMISSQKVFDGLVISKIQTLRRSCESSSQIEIIVCVSGNRFLSIYNFSYDFNHKTFQLTERLKCHNFNDWILTVKVVSDLLFVVNAHNEVIIFDWMQKQIKDTISGSDKCILYSAELLSVSENPMGFVLSSGTVFKEIIIWCAYQSANSLAFEMTSLQRLRGHDGVIFAINYSDEMNLLISASDDRSVRVWKSNSKPSSDWFEFWKQNQFTLFHVFYGHLSRIWSVMAINKPFPIAISVGEDSSAYLWNINDKKLIRKIQGHKNSSIWTMATELKTLSVFLGGSDCCLYFCDISHAIKSFQLETGRDLHPKQIKFVVNKTIDLFCATVIGDFVIKSSDVSDVIRAKNSDYRKIFSNYCAIDSNEDRNAIILGSKCGKIALIQMIGENDDPFKITIESIQNSKVFSVCFVDSSHFISCGIEGNIKLISIENFNQIISEYVLPASRHRWPTAGLRVKQLLIIGDRCGSIFIYKDSTESPTKGFHNLHGSNGVTTIKQKPNSSQVYSAGRNGKIFELLVKDNDCHLLRTFRVFSDMEWIGGFEFDKQTNQMSYIYGFQSRDFVVWDERQQKIVESMDCGGGHRSWDFTVHRNNFYFCYTKNENVFQLKKCSKLNACTDLSITKPSHTKKINCCTILFQTSSSAYFATAGEDNMIHINSLDLKNNDWKIDFYLFGHISNITALTAANNDFNDCYLVSVGGRSQLMVWQISNNTQQLVVRQLFNKFLWPSNKLKNKVFKTNSHLSSTDPQIRYLDANVSRYSEHIYLISTACSDSAIRLFEFNQSSTSFELIAIRIFNSNCILRVLNGHKNSLITASTDGIIKLWLIVANSSTLDTDTEQMELEALHDIDSHECGVNALDLFQFNGT